MVTGNDPENVIIDFGKEKRAEYPSNFFDTHIAMHNGIDWVEFEQTRTKFSDPEELFQSARKKTPEKLNEEQEKTLRTSCKATALIDNLGHSSRFLAVVDNARMILSQNIVLYFKRGSLVYLFEKKFYYRPSDLLKKS